jgi:tripartite-type tricarboxylate transporter receptor subunit TctC
MPARFHGRCLLLCSFIALSAIVDAGAAQAPFYEGKTLRIVVAATPGALLPFLRKYIAGNPAIILEFMDGSGGRKAANYMYSNARPDGLTLGSLSGGVIALSILKETGAMYDADPILPAAMAKVVRETPRDTEVIDTLKKLSGAGPLPPR